MTETAIEVQLNPAEETVQCGHLTIRFLMTGEHSNGSIAAFEMTVFCSGQWRESALMWGPGRF